MSSSKNLEYEKTAFLSKSNSAFIEDMYIKFINNDPTLPDSWKRYFHEIGDEIDIIVNEINGPSWSPSKKVSVKKIEKVEKNENREQNEFDIIKSNSNSIKAVAMIRSYRQRGHLIAKLDPLGLLKSDYLDELHPESYGFKKQDYQKRIYAMLLYWLLLLLVVLHRTHVFVLYKSYHNVTYADRSPHSWHF